MITKSTILENQYCGPCSGNSDAVLHHCDLLDRALNGDSGDLVSISATALMGDLAQVVTFLCLSFPISNMGIMILASLF